MCFIKNIGAIANTKNGFIKAEGVYDEVIDEDFILHEFGFEAEII